VSSEGTEQCPQLVQCSRTQARTRVADGVVCIRSGVCFTWHARPSLGPDSAALVLGYVPGSDRVKTRHCFFACGRHCVKGGKTGMRGSNSKIYTSSLVQLYMMLRRGDDPVPLSPVRLCSKRHPRIPTTNNKIRHGNLGLYADSCSRS
jgi:hypothetical protein